MPARKVGKWDLFISVRDSIVTVRERRKGHKYFSYQEYVIADPFGHVSYRLSDKENFDHPLAKIALLFLENNLGLTFGQFVKATHSKRALRNILAEYVRSCEAKGPKWQP